MKRMVVPALVMIATLVPASLAAQAQKESLANAILAARQRNASLLQEYNWNSRTEILENGKMQDLRIDLVSIGADGRLSRTLLNDQPGQVPRGFLRGAIAQGQQQQAGQTVRDLSALVDQYTLPSAGKVIAFIVQAQVQPITTADGKSLLKVSGADVVVPGDTFTMVFSGATLQPTSVEVTTSYNGEEVTVSGTFNAIRSGPNGLQYATADLPSKNLSVMIHNYDFVPSD